MFEQAFKNIDDVLWKEAGCTTELDYTEQSSWLLFLKYLDGLEEDKATEAQLAGKKYSYILDKPYRWETWAAPKGKDGKLDHNSVLTGDDLRDFVNGKLFPYLHGFKAKATGPNTIEYKIGEIFGEIKNKIQSGYNLREIIDHVDELRFRSQAEKHELSHLYEAKIKNMGNAGRNGGEYYTPRPLIRAMVRVVNPQIGERIYDGAVLTVINAWHEQGKKRTSETRHDFREWCQVMDWIVQNIFHAAPLMDDHAEAKERAASPQLTFLRALAIAVNEDHRLNQSLSATQLVNLCVEKEVMIPGLSDDKQADTDAGKKQLGIIMAKLFGERSELMIEEFRVTKTEEAATTEGGNAQTLKRYRFSILSATDAPPPPPPVNTPVLPSPQHDATRTGIPPNPIKTQ